MNARTLIMDTHMHTTVSDGTDSPEEILGKVMEAGIELFALTDHDGIKGCSDLERILSPSDPAFLAGVEFNSRDNEGKYHILGYGYDPAAKSIVHLVDKARAMRMKKARVRIDELRDRFGFTFPQEETQALFALYNPGKPHIGNLMVKYGYAASKDSAIREYLDKIKTPDSYVGPEEAIKAIRDAGGIPVLAHPPYGSGDELIMGDDLNERVKRLMSFGLEGLEGYYSQYTAKMRDQVLSIAAEYDLYITAGSDYHGRNKMVILGDTGLSEETDRPRGLIRFIERAESLIVKVG